MKIGIVCHPSIGGSGIVATNLGLQLAKLGHRVHFISYEPPFRLQRTLPPRVFFHPVPINAYSVFKYPDYTLPLAVTIEEVQRRFGLDLIHAHYALPHATAALLALGIMRQNGLARPKLITTLHGTDITLLARDPSLYAIIRYSVEKSDGVTAVSRDLRRETLKVLKTRKAIAAIYNFYSPQPPRQSADLVRRRLGLKPDDFLAIHLSNLRPVKRIPDLLQIAHRLRRQRRFKLLILAGGDFSPFRMLVKKYALNNLLLKSSVKNIADYLNAADAGLYTSETESFGMGMLETMAYQNPIVATRAGGIPEVVTEGKSGFLVPVGDIAGFVGRLERLLENSKLTARMGAAAQADASRRFCAKNIVGQYVDYYRRVLKEKS